MPLINVVLVLIIVGVLLWVVNTFIPMDGKIKQIMNVLVVICVVLWILTLFFPALGGVGQIKVGR